MASAGSKRVARATHDVRNGLRERDKVRHLQDRETDRAQSGSTPDRNKAEHKKESSKNTRPGSLNPSRKEKQPLSEAELERLKTSELWNAEKQRMKKQETRRLKFLRQRQRLKERKKAFVQKPDTKPVKASEDAPDMEKEDTALVFSAVADVSDTNSTSGGHAKIDESEKYDLAVKFGWVDRNEHTPEPVQDHFVDSASEEDQALYTNVARPSTEMQDTIQGLQLQSRQILQTEHQPRTPSPTPLRDSATPPQLSQPKTAPDILIITPGRCPPSPQLEHLISPTSSTTNKAAATLLLILKSRTQRLNNHITAFDAQLKSHPLPASSCRPNSDSSAPKIKILRRIIRTIEKHSNAVFMLEFAFRDVVDEGDEDLLGALRKTEREFGELVKRHEGKMRKLMRRLSPGAMERTVGKRIG